MPIPFIFYRKELSMMQTVNIITVGKLKESYFRDACAEYAKRLGAFCKLNITELPESRLPDNPSQNEIAKALENEGKEMLALMSSKSAYNIAMCIEGKQLSSVELSAKLDEIAVSGGSTVNFVIGSSFGICDEVKNKCQLRMSMSKMTFPHMLARVMLLEQIYRAYQISSGGKYHK